MSNLHVKILNLRIQKRGNKKLIVHAIYRPPAGNIDEFTKILDQTMSDTFVEFGGDTLLLEDMNIDYNRNNNTKIKKLSAVTGKFALSQLIESDTRITQRHSSKIDLLLDALAHVNINCHK